MLVLVLLPGVLSFPDVGKAGTGHTASSASIAPSRTHSAVVPPRAGPRGEGRVQERAAPDEESFPFCLAEEEDDNSKKELSVLSPLLLARGKQGGDREALSGDTPGTGKVSGSGVQTPDARASSSSPSSHLSSRTDEREDGAGDDEREHALDTGERGEEEARGREDAT